MTCHPLQTGHVPAGLGQAPYYSLVHDSTGNRKHDRDGLRRLFRGHRGWCATRDDHIDTCPHQVGCEFGQSVLVAFCKAVLHDEASTLYIPKVMEALEENLDPPSSRALRRIGSEDPDLVYLARLLGFGGERRGEEAASDRRHEGTSLHH